MAAYDFVDNGIAYTITSFSDLECAVVANDHPYSGSINIPAVVNYLGKELKITSVGSGAFLENVELTTVSLGENVLSIGNKAFQGCSSLNKIVLNDQLNSIGEYAFANCISLSQLNLPLSINTISEGAFSECSNLSNINIPESLSIISPYLFYDCAKLQSITLNGVTSIGNSSFENCGNLSAISLGENISKIGDMAFKNCNSLNSIIFPDNLNSIGDECFAYTNINEFYIPDNGTTIGENAIYGCKNLKLLSIGAGISTIERSLWGCSKVETLEIRYNSTELNFKSDTKDLAYTGSTLESHKTYNGIFKNLEVKNLVINRPIYMTRMYEDIFPPFMGNKYIERIEILDGYEYGNGNQSELCFANCSNLKEVLINNSNLTIPSPLFYPDSELHHYPFFGYCYKLEKITLIVKGIGEKAFYNCSKLSEVNLSDVVQIQTGAFNGCTSLQNITLPPSIKSLSNAIVNCPLDTITILAKTPPSSSEFNSTIYLTTKLEVPNGKISSYKAVSPWNNFWNISEANPVPAESIILNRNEINLLQRDDFQLKATILPVNTYDKLVWESLDPTIANVTDDGLVTAFNKGSTTIIVKCGDISANCNVIVERSQPSELSFTFNGKDWNDQNEFIYANIGDNIVLLTAIYPISAGGSTITYKSLDGGLSFKNQKWIEEYKIISQVDIAVTKSRYQYMTASCGDLTYYIPIIVSEDAGVESLLANPENEISIYSTDGILIKKNCKVEDLKSLSKGIYIIVSEKEHYKIAI